MLPPLPSRQTTSSAHESKPSTSANNVGINSSSSSITRSSTEPTLAEEPATTISLSSALLDCVSLAHTALTAPGPATSPSAGSAGPGGAGTGPAAASALLSHALSSHAARSASVSGVPTAQEQLWDRAARYYAHSLLAVALCHGGRFPAAAEAATAALELSPGDDFALVTRAYALAQQGRYDEARADAHAALRRNPRNDAAWGTRASSYIDVGDYEQAISDARRSLRLNPANEASRLNLLSAYLRKAGTHRKLHFLRLAQANAAESDSKAKDDGDGDNDGDGDSDDDHSGELLRRAPSPEHGGIDAALAAAAEDDPALAAAVKAAEGWDWDGDAAAAVLSLCDARNRGSAASNAMPQGKKAAGRPVSAAVGARKDFAAAAAKAKSKGKANVNVKGCTGDSNSANGDDNGNADGDNAGVPARAKLSRVSPWPFSNAYTGTPTAHGSSAAETVAAAEAAERDRERERECERQLGLLPAEARALRTRGFATALALHSVLRPTDSLEAAAEAALAAVAPDALALPTALNNSKNDIGSTSKSSGAGGAAGGLRIMITPGDKDSSTPQNTHGGNKADTAESKQL